MVVYSDREYTFGLLLTNHILVENLVDFRRDRQLGTLVLGTSLLNFFTDDIVAEINALVSYKHGRTRNQLAHFILALATE